MRGTGARWDEAVLLDVHPGVSRMTTWGVADATARALEAALRAGRSPSGICDGPWAVTLQCADGSVIATSSPASQAGLCWTWDEGRNLPTLIVSPFLGAVVAAGSEASLSTLFAARKMGVEPATAQLLTPFQNVWGIPPGVTATFRGPQCEPQLEQWCGPQAWGDPHLNGPDLPERYLNAFDAAVDALIPADGPLCATMSGGLDSTFVVSSLARHASARRPVHAFTHSPHPAARLAPVGNWDPDDYPVAAAMQRLHPHLILHRVVNTERRQPLTLAAQSARDLWYPLPNSVSLPWLRAIDHDAAQLGAARLFYGGGGNATFSSSHDYAIGYHLARGQFAQAARLTRPYPGQQVIPGVATGPELLAKQLLELPSRRREQPVQHPWSRWVPLAHTVTRWSGTPRQRYLQWLGDRRHRALTHAATGWSTPPVDPFATESMLNLAAAITPAAWARAGSDRGFARLVARGRLPDEIRLRTRRGAQSWDTWYTIHDEPELHLDAAEKVINDPDLGDWMDADALLGALRELPWGQPRASAPQWLDAMIGLLAFGVAWQSLREVASAVGR